MIRTRRTVLLSVLLVLAAVSPAAARSADGLAPPLREWISHEQGRMSRDVDTTRLVPLTNGQDPRYAPEAGQTFRVKSYWVDAGKLHAFVGDGMAPELRSILTRTQAGREQVRFLVHPESEPLYREFLRGATRADDLMATPTASSRTLLCWPQQRPQSAFFAKVSLDKVIGGARRTVSQGEVARSVGTNNVLQAAARKGELPASFKFMAEVMSAIPVGMEEGGMLIRQIPPEVRSGAVRVTPLFSLYADPKEGGRPLLADMIRQSGLPAERYVREKIIRPFAQQWLQLAVVRGIAMEPHAQNVLLELGRDGQPTGNLLHRDFGGFAIDFDHRAQKRMAAASELPRITSIPADYKTDRYADRQVKGIDTYFYGGFVYNLDQKLPQWSRKGWLPGPAVEPGTFKRVLVEELERQYQVMTGKKLRIGDDLSRVGQLLNARREVRWSSDGTVRPKGSWMQRFGTGLRGLLGEGRSPARGAAR